jgi:hypothetical protein
MTLAALLPLVDTHLAAVYAVAVGLSAGQVLFNPAAAAALPAIVDDDELVTANSGLWSAAVVSQIALAPVAGAIVAAWGVGPAFWFNAATFAVSAVILVGQPLPHPGAPGPAAAEAWRRLVDGGRLLLADPSSGLEVKVIKAILIRLLPGTRSVL